MFDVQKIRSEFEILLSPLDGKRLVYLDNASTTQKPRAVLDCLSQYYKTMNANIHRGVHTLSERATEAYEGVRTSVAEFIGANESSEIVFTRGTTESINLVASSYGDSVVNASDVVVVSGLEHHSNLVPWQQLCQRRQAKLKVIPLQADGQLDLSSLEKIFDGSEGKVKVVALTQMSNVLGVQTPVKKIVQLAHQHGAKVLLDAAQGVLHLGLNVKDLDIDFAAFSSHKMFGPTGVGVLWARHEILEAMPPYQFGGDMVKEVTLLDARWNDVPWKFEAGTPNIADVIAFGAAVNFLKGFDMSEIAAHDQKLYSYARNILSDGFSGLRLLGPDDATLAGGALSIVIDGVHPHDIGSILNDSGVAVRTGHHCAQPLMQHFGVPATVRASFTLYNDIDDIDALAEALKKVYTIFAL